ncbi:uncharacterized protein LOC135368444 [Ornithodoros turicata]|uniref:uncharacterized protein LOC135368444 n=1 Tax=Ornithodoros turicata TaxID=34597 RepID=UPI0031393494
MESRKLIAHPSVRIRGSENNFLPVRCTNEKCHSKDADHLHCPFCPKAVVFQDDRIAEAHYRVKHVDKGICFAGLKMLRCCALCNISGAIKGEKRFKGPHWHCYKCKNGFSRRDEALKHYQTHFKQPQTTFQINIAQDVNEGMGLSRGDAENGMDAEESSMTHGAEGATANEVVTIDVTAEEASRSVTSPSSACDEPTTVMIIQESDEQPQTGMHPSHMSEDNAQKMAQLERQVAELKQQVEQAKVAFAAAERALRSEIDSLQQKLNAKTFDLQQAQRREQELLAQKAPSIDGKLQYLMSTLQKQHKELLQQHILQARNEAYQSAFKELQNGTVLTTIDASGTPTMVHQDNSLVAMVLDSSGTMALPVSLATAQMGPVMCYSPSPSKSLLHKQGNMAPILLSGGQTYTAAPSRTIQQTVGNQQLILAVAEATDNTEMLSASQHQGNAVVTCRDMQYQIANIAPTTREGGQENLEECIG